MKKVCILGVMAWITVVALAWNVSLAECESNWIFYDTWANVTYIDTNGKSFTWIGTITVCYSWEEITLLDRNLGASMTWHWNNEQAYWYRFQWWNNYGFPTTWELNIATDIVDASDYSWSNPYVSGAFVRVPGTTISWDSGSNIDLWWGTTSFSYQRQGPCPEWYHVPTAQEQESWLNIYKKIYPESWFDDFLIKFFVTLPWSWYPYSSSDLRLNNPGVDWYYWSSTKWDTSYRIRHMYVTSWSEKMVDSNRSYALPVRCFANQTYIVSFETNGWSNVISLTGLEWTKIKAPETPIRMWYSFSGWYLSGTDVERDFNTNVVTWNTVLYAKWNKLELDDWLILYYTFDWDSVDWNRVIDQSSQNNTWTANEWVKFNGSGSVEFNWTWFIDFADFWVQWNINQTLSVWVKGDIKNNQIVIWSSYSVWLGFHGWTHLIWFASKNPAGKNKWIIENYHNGAWNHIVVTVDGQKISYYMNWKVLINSETSTHYRNWFATWWRIWARWDWTTSFSWYLDEVRVYNRVLSEEEIKELYNSWFNAWNIECSISYARSLENSGNIDAFLDCPVEVIVTSEWKSSTYTFTESGSYIFEFDYWWNAGSKVANVSWYNIQFVAWDNWTLSWNTEYNVLVRDDESNFESLGINIPEPIANSGYIFNWWLETSPTSWTIVNRNLVFTAQFKETEKSYSDLDEPKVSWWWSWWWGHRAVSDKSSDRGSDFNGEVEITYEDEYSLEMNEAYQFAFENWITTKETINDADMDWVLTRIAMAKMLSQYAINVLWKAPANLIVPKFVDVTDEMNEQYNYGVSLAYQLWIMWINMTDNKFRPNDLVTRAEFGTALSRMLYGITDWEESYYSTHLDRLYEEWIITNQNPNLQELRGYVMLMLMRSKK